MGFVAAFLLFSFAAIVEGDYDDPPKPKISETFSTWVSFEHLYSYYSNYMSDTLYVTVYIYEGDDEPGSHNCSCHGR